jgi:uncharacterized metal-binding protein YceD (DUF177 family)
VKAKNEYQIPYKGLKEGIHEFTFVLNQEFFDDISSGEEIHASDLKVKVIASKSGVLMSIETVINGKVAIPCDRCLDDMECKISFEGKLYIKPGYTEDADETDSDNDELMVVQPEQGEIDLTQYLYESVVLSLPYHRVHPEKGGKSGCNPLMIEKLKEHSAGEESIDPRWESLLSKLKN